jgi:hypothetical protein
MPCSAPGAWTPAGVPGFGVPAGPAPVPVPALLPAPVLLVLVGPGGDVPEVPLATLPLLVPFPPAAAAGVSGLTAFFMRGM